MLRPLLRKTVTLSAFLIYDFRLLKKNKKILRDSLMTPPPNQTVGTWLHRSLTGAKQ